MPAVDHGIEARQRRLGRLASGIARCRRCPLHHGRRRAVPGTGPANARVMFIGEAPGAREDATGYPFAGRAGTWFDAMLVRAGLDRNEVFVTSAVKCRPPGNRRPRAGELRICREAWLLPQIAAVDPALLVLLGTVAAAQILGERRALGELRGRLLDVPDRRVLVTAHPAAAMRFPEPRRWLEADMELLRQWLASETAEGR
ncbi:MAG: uracil-DNA glycosylase [Pseudomonadota bacterium]